MTTPMQLYWITRLDKIVDVSITISVIIVIVSVLLLIPALIEQVFSEYKIWFLTAWLITLFFTVVAIFTPTTKEMAYIIFFPRLMNSKIVSELPDDFIEIKELAMDYVRNNLIQKEK